MSLSGIYKNTKSLSGVNQTTQDIANLYLNNLNVTLDVSNLIVSNTVVNNKLANLISSNITVFGLLSNLSNANVQSNVRITALENKTQNITSISNNTVINSQLNINGNISGTTQANTGIYLGFDTSNNPLIQLVARGNVSGNLSAIDFTHPNFSHRGRIEFNHNQNAFRLYSQGSQILMSDGFGNFRIGTGSVLYALDVTRGDINTNTQYRLNGNIVINSTTFGNIQSNITALQAGNTSAHTQILALQNANVNLQLGNLSAHTQLIALSSNLSNLSLANVNLQLGNLSAHNQIIALKQGNAQSNIRLTTLENKTQLLTSNATVSNIAGNLMISDTITIFGNANITNGMLVLPNNTLVLPNLQAFTGTTTSGTITVTASSFSGTEFPWYALQFNQPPATINTFSSAVTYDLSTGNYTGSVSTTLLNGTTYTGEWWQMYSTSPFIPYTININALFSSTAREYYFLGSKTGTNGSWVLLRSSTTYNAGNLTMDNVSFPMNYLRIVCNKVQAGTNPARFYIAYLTMTGGSGGNMRIDGYVMGDLRLYNGNINTSTGLITGGMGLVAGGLHGTRVPTSQSGYMGWNVSGGSAETSFWTIQPSNSFWEGFRWNVRTLSPETNTQIMTLTKSGWLGLNRTNPQFPLDINGQFNSIAYGQPSAGKYFSRNVGLTNMGSSNNFNCSICATGSIWINSLSGNSLDNSFVSGNSDKRIKENIKEIDGKEALEKIRKLRPVYYDYIDRYENGLQNIGYIAQEVKEIVPQSVDDKYKNFIPNVFTFGKWKDNLIKFDKPHGLKGEGKIQVVLQKHDKMDYLYEEKEEWEFTVVNGKVLEVSKDTQTETKIFVYGEYVSNFHVLGDKFINIIAVSALKEIDKRLSRLENLMKRFLDK